MNKRKLPLLAALPAAIFAANASANDVTVYGKVNVSLQAIEVDSSPTPGIDDQDNWELLSNASRLGVKGAIDLGDSGLQAIYKLEYETAVDDGEFGTNQTFKQRNIYGGFKGGFGSVIAGKFDTPTKKAQGKVDLFNDQFLGDIKNVIEGENRENNSIQYSTPDMGGFGANLAFMPGEDNNAGDDDGVADHVSASVTYDSDALYLALAADDDVQNRDLIRLVGQFKVANMAFGAILQQAEAADDDELLADEGVASADEDSVVLSAKFKIGDGAIKAQYALAETDYDTNDDQETDMWTIGYDHKLSKAAKIYAYYSDMQRDNVDGVDGDEEEADTLAVGFEVKF